MTYSTILTSKGTTTIPAAIRRKLGMKPGMFVHFSEDGQTGRYFVERSMTIEEVRAMNKAAMKLAGTAHKPYRSGDGWRAHVLEKYGRRHA